MNTNTAIQNVLSLTDKEAKRLDALHRARKAIRLALLASPGGQKIIPSLTAYDARALNLLLTEVLETTK